MKIVCKDQKTTKEIASKGITIFNQRFSSKYLEREIFVNCNPCMRCFKYGHYKNKCNRSQDYAICSICSIEGHTFRQCNQSTPPKCINCKGQHKTLSFSCPLRKEFKNKKIKEQKEKQKSPPKTETTEASMNNQISSKLDAQYLAVIASTFVLANMREQECPGSFTYIVEEMFAAN